MARARFEIRQWNAEQLLARTTRILEDFAPVIAEEARTQIKTVKWKWPNSTLRFQSLYQQGKPVSGTQKNGAGWSGVVVPRTRDIVDRGRLLNSQQAPQVQKNVLSIEWTAPYSGVVLRGGDYGEYTNPAGKRAVVGVRPARNWIDASFEAQPFLPFFVARWNELAGGGRRA